MNTEESALRKAVTWPLPEIDEGLRVRWAPVCPSWCVQLVAGMPGRSSTASWTWSPDAVHGSVTQSSLRWAHGRFQFCSLETGIVSKTPKGQPHVLSFSSFLSPGRNG